MVSPLSISETVAYIESILKDIEKDYPELTVNTQNLQGDITGRALRVNQQPVVERVLQRRANYDDALIRAQKMALAIGGFRNYKGYQGFGLDSYEAGKLDHSIGSRPVFGRDPMDDYDLEGKLWEVAKEANDLGVPLDVFLEMKGWEKDRIDKIVQSPSYQAKIEALNNLRKMANGNNDDQGSQSGNQSGLESRFAKKDQKDGATSNA